MPDWRAGQPSLLEGSSSVCPSTASLLCCVAHRCMHECVKPGQTMPVARACRLGTISRMKTVDACNTRVEDTTAGACTTVPSCSCDDAVRCHHHCRRRCCTACMHLHINQSLLVTATPSAHRQHCGPHPEAGRRRGRPLHVRPVPAPEPLPAGPPEGLRQSAAHAAAGRPDACKLRVPGETG